MMTVADLRGAEDVGDVHIRHRLSVPAQSVDHAREDGLGCRTRDGHLVLEVAACPDTDEACARSTLRQIMTLAETDTGYAAVEEPPPGSRDEFIARAELWAGPSG